MLDVVTVYTDGSGTAKTEEPGGFAYTIQFKDRRVERWNWKPAVTVNQMEMAAIQAALLTVKLTRHPLFLYSDSLYCVNALTQWIHSWTYNGWITATGQPVKNRKMIERTAFLLERHRKVRHVCLYHVKGHSGVWENERCDYLAGRARKEKMSNCDKEVIL